MSNETERGENERPNFRAAVCLMPIGRKTYTPEECKTRCDEIEAALDAKDKLIRDAQDERDSIRKRFDERCITPNEYEKMQIRKPLLDKIASLEAELAEARADELVWLDQKSAVEDKAWKLEQELDVQRKIVGTYASGQAVGDIFYKGKKLSDWEQENAALKTHLRNMIEHAEELRSIQRSLLGDKRDRVKHDGYYEEIEQAKAALSGQPSQEKK